MATASVVQAVIGSTPIVDVEPPNEGRQAVTISYQMTPTAYFTSNVYQLNSQNGIMMSQVVSIMIDNTVNSNPLVVTHGVLNQKTLIPGGFGIIIPTFSNRSTYPLTLAMVGAPAADVTINITLMNYEKQATEWGFGPKQSVMPFYSGVFNGTGTGNTTLLAPGNYVLNAIDFTLEWAVPTAAGQLVIVAAIKSGSINLASIYPAVNASSTAIIAGAAFINPVHLGFPQGLVLTRNTSIILDIVTMVNTTNVGIRINIAGQGVP